MLESRYLSPRLRAKQTLPPYHSDVVVVQLPRVIGINSRGIAAIRRTKRPRSVPIVGVGVRLTPFERRAGACFCMAADDSLLRCPLCGQSHSTPVLKRGQRALCVRCGTVIAEHDRLGGKNATLALTLTGLFLAIPSLVLPLVTLEKFGRERVTVLTAGFEGFWTHGFESLGMLVLLCGTLAPFGLLGLLATIILTESNIAFQKWNGRLRRWADAIEYWAMPEVQVLGVMVAFFKLGDVVNLTVGPGLWCYGATSLFTLMAWRRFHLQPAQPRPPALASAATVAE